VNILLAYLSQTGNTRKVAETMADELRAGAHKVRTVPMTDLIPADILICDVLGFGSPCFESQAPAPVKAFLSTLPDLKGKPAFVFATTGGAPVRVLHDLARGLRSKGAIVISGLLVRGELHHPAPCLKGRMPGRPDRDDLEKARAFARSINLGLLAGRTASMENGTMNRLDMKWGFYELVSLIAQPFLLRILLPRPIIDTASCSKCGLCVKECPAASMKIDPYPEPDSSCIRCYRCQNVCPKKAIGSSWLLVNMVIFALYNTLFSRLFGDVKPGERIY
jgi:flavodoxin/NAD-dependent dihydropyrimidine dehydrogenase PreA subunit